MNLVLDNIVFALQRVGGISVVWQELLQRALQDPDISAHVLDYACDNVCREQLAQYLPLWDAKPYRRMERYRTPDFCATADQIFHSSYFRTLPGAHNVTTIHDLTYHYYRHGPAKWVHLTEEEHALRNSDRVICVSDHTRSDLLRHYNWLNEEMVFVVPNGVGEHFAPIPKVEKQGYLLFVGTRSVGYKRFDMAVEVARRTGLELVAIGAPATQEETAKLDALLGAGRYRLISGVSNVELNQYYNEALCLLYPSDYEGFGIPVLEAQRAGCPVVAQAVSSVPEVAGDGAMLVPHSADNDRLAADLTDAVTALLNGRIDWVDLQTRAADNASRYSWERTYQLTKQVYQSIL